jgi:PAS domain S-box-containing protein
MNQNPFQFLLDHVNNAIVLLDDQANTMWFNDTFQEFFGWRHTEIIGRSAELFLEGSSYQHIKGSLVRDDELHSLFKGIVSLKTKQGESLTLQGELIQIDTYLHPYFALIIEVHNEKENIRKLIEAKQAAEEAHKAQSAFLANISHEIRTPLNAIMGLSELLISLGLPPKQEKYAKSIYQSGETLLAIINDLLDLSKMEAGEISLDSVSCDLCQLIEEVILLLVPRTFDKEVTIHFFYPPALPRRVITDPIRIREIVMNFLSNAIKFTDQGYILVSCYPAGSYQGKEIFEIAVSDTGIGVDENFKERIFNKFSQADASSTKRFASTGLGLAICKLIVEKLEGRIGFDSVDDKGSTFFAQIPVQLGVEEEEEFMLPGIRRVLIVEPNEIDRFILSEYCLFLGLEVVAVESVEKAVVAMEKERFRRRSFDLVIYSLQMQEEALHVEIRMHKAKQILFEWEQIFDQYVLVPQEDNAILLPKPTSVLELQKTINKAFKRRAVNG